MAGRQKKISEEGIKRLSEYWFRADLMHECLHTIREMYEGVDGVLVAGHSWEFRTYLFFWLSGLFVVVEGFNQVGLKDARVTRLFNAHLPELKLMRHHTYHFKLTPGPFLQELNWAEELHAAIGEVVYEHITVKAKVEKLMEIRAKKKRR